jgi:hypothetical protein
MIRVDQRHRKGYVAAALIAFVLAITAPAAVAHQTSGDRTNWSESWSGTGWNLIESANYNANTSGTHNVYGHAGSSCPGAGNQYQVRPVHEHTFIPDHPFVGKTYTCGVESNRTWSISDSGDFHLDIQQVGGTGGDTWFVPGHVHYP